MTTVSHHAGVRYLIELREAGHGAVADANAFAAALAAGTLFAAGLPSEAERALDAHADSFAATAKERDTLRALALDVAGLESLQ